MPDISGSAIFNRLNYVSFRFDCLFTPRSRQLPIGIRAVLSGKELNCLERRRRGPGMKNEELPVFDDESNTDNIKEGSKTGASTDAKLEELMKRQEKLMSENSELRRKAKAKKTKGGSS
jgi:hypothetical protein